MRPVCSSRQEGRPPSTNHSKYLLNDKTALAEIAEFELAPQEFGSRVQKTLANLGESEASLEVAVKSVEELLRESVALSQELHRSRYELPATIQPIEPPT